MDYIDLNKAIVAEILQTRCSEAVVSTGPSAKMLFRLLLLLLTACTLFTPSLSEKCATPVSQEDCENMTSEYDKYRECMERRTKRSADCFDDDDLNCDKCNCNTCSYSSCESSCTTNVNCCEKCCPRSSSCTTSNCCHQSCRAECRSNSCRTSCKRRCQDRIVSLPQPQQVAPAQITETKTVNQHNITTVIHLKNIVNNTNLINLPIKINTTVLNNITSGGAYGGVRHTKEGQRSDCCLTIGPRQCVPQSSFPFMRCFHVRKRSCGSMCSAPVVHYQSHEICDNNVNSQQPCHQQMVYIPQPQPRCAYQPSWPYVTCGNQEQQSCDGCYSHYIKREDVTKCSNFCYDDGYGAGPYYRQAPFFRPGYAHAPSCYQTGQCGFGGYDIGDTFEGLPENGFPNAYPAETYPFVIEDCENCTFAPDWKDPPAPEVASNLSYRNLQTPVAWMNDSDKMIVIDADVSPGRSQRYAEIRIKPEDKENVTTVTPVPATLF